MATDMRSKFKSKTRGGHKVLAVYKRGLRGATYPLVGLLERRNSAYVHDMTWSESGCYWGISQNRKSVYDLIPIQRKKAARRK